MQHLSIWAHSGHPTETISQFGAEGQQSGRSALSLRLRQRPDTAREHGFYSCNCNKADQTAAAPIPDIIAQTALLDRIMTTAESPTAATSRQPPWARMDATSAATTDTDIPSRNRSTRADVSTCFIMIGPAIRLRNVTDAITRIAAHGVNSLVMRYNSPNASGQGCNDDVPACWQPVQCCNSNTGGQNSRDDS